jgi:hypothetical protein
MATLPVRPREYATRKAPFNNRAKQFWQRVTEGIELNQLWSQFRKDAHSSYRLYSQEVDPTRIKGVSRRHHFFHIASQFFWAIVEKVTPARRVLLLIALVLVIVPGGVWTWTTRSHEVKIFAFDFHFYGGLLIFRSAHLRGRRSGGDEARSSDRKGDSSMAFFHHNHPMCPVWRSHLPRGQPILWPETTTTSLPAPLLTWEGPPS